MNILEKNVLKSSFLNIISTLAPVKKKMIKQYFWNGFYFYFFFKREAGLL